jgi:hypothetical protein
MSVSQTQRADLGAMEGESSDIIGDAGDLRFNQRNNRIRSNVHSACGLKVELEIWIGKSRHVATSTIGGLIRLNGPSTH